MKVGIAGYGFVGQAMHSIINISEVVIYDKFKKKYNQSSLLLDCDIVFVCVSTPQSISGAQDASNVVEILEYLKNEKYKGSVVVKSTVLHRHIEKYSESLNLVYNPEFLNQNTSFDDAENQNVIILGGEYKSVDPIVKFYQMFTSCSDADFQIMSIKEASDFKYTRNLYGAFKVLFWEFIQDTTGNSRKMSELFKMLPYQTEMSQIGMDGKRGFGGACFPKDTIAWDKEHNHRLTHFMLQYNRELGN
jgi:UDPglucose 6-dehydrogenase